MSVVDLMAGAGGWEVGARQVGLDVVGIENDPAACATRDAAGLRTIRADVADVFPPSLAPIDGLIGSPPCQGFSHGGAKAGVSDLPLLATAAGEISAGFDARVRWRHVLHDPRSVLMLEPLAWIKQLHPTWVALEQVPPALEMWKVYEALLRMDGYHVWSGLLQAEQYGVPQVRTRAFLLAHLERPVTPPAPTHQSYIPGRTPRAGVTQLPWVSMGDALGWVPTEQNAWTFQQPAPTVVGAFGGRVRAKSRERQLISDAEALVLQGFPADFPVQGTPKEQFMQIGNAVPPPLAAAALGCVCSRETAAV
jgi:DNA (cytosine-5)-methyltransferase 1